MEQSSGDTGILTLGAVMMVKDESKNLKRCLESIKDFVDKIYIVDTGSKDNTIEIARSYNASVYIPDNLDDYFVETENGRQINFSKVRNKTLEISDCDWNFVVDADEEVIVNKGFTKESFMKWIAETLEPKNCVCVAIKVEDINKGNCIMEFNSTRIFKRGMVRYEGIVHNAPQLKSKLGAMFNGWFKIKHYGYDLTPEEKQKKFERTNGLLLHVLKIKPDDWLMYFYLCQIHADMGKLDKAVEYGETYLQHKEELRKHNNFNTSIYFTLIHNYMTLNNISRARELVEEGLKEIPDDLDLSMAMTEFGVLTKQLDIIVSGAKKYLELYEKFQRNPGAKQNRFIYTNNIICLTSILYYLTGTLITEGAKFLDIFVNTVLPNIKDVVQRKKFMVDMVNVLTCPPPTNSPKPKQKQPVDKRIKPLVTI